MTQRIASLRATAAAVPSRLPYLFAIAALCGAFASTPAQAQLNTLIFDGFGDADINNNGIPFEDVDTDVAGTPPNGLPDTYVPARLEDINGDGPANPEVTALTPGVDPSDTGIRWYQMRGFTGGDPGPGPSKPTIRIVDDSQGAMQETMASGLNIPAIDDGLAMSWESRGGGSSAAGFFDERVTLGPNEGDEVKVSFDFRLWRDAPNPNAPPNNVPQAGELRFGLFQDTDGQLGQTNPIAGRLDEFGGFTPAVWGQEEGQFDGSLTGVSGGAVADDVGANGDNGWTASVFFGDSFIPNGGGTRIREELQADRILQGNDTHTIAQPEDIDPSPFDEEFDFVTLDNDGVYNIALTLVRDTVETPGDTITATLTLTDKLTGTVLGTLSGTEDLDDAMSNGIPVPGTGGIQSDSWDYFALRNASNGVSEFDFILDNFLVETSDDVGSAIPGDFDGDGDVDGADFGVFVAEFQTGDTGGVGAAAPFSQADFNESGFVDGADFGVFVDSFQNFPPVAVAVPEPAAGLLAAVGLLATCWRRGS